MRQMNEYSLNAIITKAYYQINYSESVDVLLSERKLSFLLTEEIGPDELSSLEDLAKNAKDNLEKVRTDANMLGLSNSVEYIDNLLGEIPDVPDLVSVAIENDPKKSAEKIGKVAAATKKANSFRDSYVKAISLFGDNLAKLDIPDDVDRTQTLEDLATAGTGGFPALDKLETAAKAAYNPPPEDKGVFKKIASFFGFGADLSKEKFSEDILGASLNDIVKKAQEMKATAAEAGSDEAKSDEAVGAIEDEVESLGAGDGSVLDVPPDTKGKEASPEEIETAAEEVASEVGSSISKAELTALLKKYPELTGKGPNATRQRRIFRKAINKVAGKEVFEEIKNHDRSLRSAYTEEEMTVYRLNKLAGLE